MILSSLLLSMLVAMTSSFEVPFPQNSAEIRASISSSKTDAGATNSQPVIRQIQLGSGTIAEVISCMPKQQKSSSASSSNDMVQTLFSSLFGRETAHNANNSQTKKKTKPTLAFLHGSFHGSWCWAEHYMTYFASLGYPCVAFSLQGTGGTPVRVESGQGRKNKVKIASHVADLDAFLRGLSDNDVSSLGLDLGNNPDVVLIGHSFGGLTIMKWLERIYGDENSNSSSNPRGINLVGVGLMCSVPPSGNGKMTMRFIRRSLKDAWKITAGFVMKKAITDKAICRDLFFGGNVDDNGISDEDVARYQSYFLRDTVATIDLGDLAKQLPSMLADKTTGRAPFVDCLPPVFVIGASEDFIVDREGVDETARYMGLEKPLIVDSPHDVMLGRRWNNGADAILYFLSNLLA